MNPFTFARRRPVTTLLLLVGLTAVGVVALKQGGVDVLPALDTSRIGSLLDSVHSNVAKADVAGEKPHQEHQKIVVTNPKAVDITLTRPYVCQIHSRRHIEVCALESGYLQEILVMEGQAVKKGELLFRILPTLYQARRDAEAAEARLAGLELNYTKSLAQKKVVSPNEVNLGQAKLAKAQAKLDLAKAELNFTNVVAPFDGIVDRLRSFQGSLIKEGDILTTLSDNSVMWVYFNVPEAAYLEYMAHREQREKEERIELKLADGSIFPQHGKIGAIEAQFNNENGNIPFRADFSNPKRLLRHGQTGTILISRTLKGAVVIPQRATFEILDKRYVYVVGEDHVVHQRLIAIEHEQDDIFTIKSGLTAADRIVLEGVREVRDGEKVEYDFQDPKEVLARLKFHAE